MQASVRWHVAYKTNAFGDHRANEQRLCSLRASFKMGSLLTAQNETRQNSHCCHLWCWDSYTDSGGLGPSEGACQPQPHCNPVQWQPAESTLSSRYHALASHAKGFTLLIPAVTPKISIELNKLLLGSLLGLFFNAISIAAAYSVLYSPAEEQILTSLCLMNPHSSASLLARLTALGCIPSAPSDLTALGLFPIYSSTSSSGTFPHITYLLSTTYQFHLNNLLHCASKPQTKLNTDCLLLGSACPCFSHRNCHIQQQHSCLTASTWFVSRLQTDVAFNSGGRRLPITQFSNFPVNEKSLSRLDNEKLLLSQNHGTVWVGRDP